MADIERGGVFASLVGTLELLPEDLRERVVGAVITKFRGDRSILAPGIEEFEDRTDTPVLGVIPYDDPGLPEEDSVSLPPADSGSLEGKDDNVPEGRAITVAVPRLPRISNFTDFGPLARTPGVRVAYVSLDDTLGDADAVILPGTKNTVDDLRALRASGMADRIRAFEGPIVGLCGGYQMLGERITNASIEGTGKQAEIRGLGLLPVETRFQHEKRVETVTRDIDGVGPLTGFSGSVTGYEIHMGQTSLCGDDAQRFATSGTAVGRVLGTYLHGLFENEGLRRAFVETVRDVANQPHPETDGPAQSPYERASTLVREHVALDPIGLADRRE